MSTRPSDRSYRSYRSYRACRACRACRAYWAYRVSHSHRIQLAQLDQPASPSRPALPTQPHALGDGAGGGSVRGAALRSRTSSGIAGVVSLLLGTSAGAAPLNPADFQSLGTLTVPNSGTLTIDTDQLTLSTPGVNVMGVARPQSGGQAATPEIAVFTFDTISIGKPVALTVRGARALALLSKDNLTVAGALTFTGTTAIGSTTKKIADSATTP